MTSTADLTKERRETVVVGLLLGAASTVLGAAWGTPISCFVLWSYLGKKKRKLTAGGVVRLAAAWLLAVILCDILMHPVPFGTGIVDGWNAGPK